MSWDQAVKSIAPHVVKIATPGGHGTGFLAFYNHDRSWCAIATAAHVVAHADEWQQPIRIEHQGSATPNFLAADKRVIMLDHNTDSAIVLFLKGDLELPEIPITLLPVETPCGIGMEVGWLGFPAIEPDTLCFFSGTVSAHLASRKAYMIDGVAIHGVSGGPVVHCTEDGEIQIVGSVSAYHANRATGEALPGLLKAQDISHFRDCSAYVQSIDEANVKKQEFEEAQKLKSQDGAHVGLMQSDADESDSPQSPS